MPRIPPVTSRRDFLKGSALLAATPSLSGLRIDTSARKLKLLVLGGTVFLGPAIVEAALARGHEVTLFNRGRSNPDLFPDVEKLRGNRRRPRDDRGPKQDLDALRGRTWDAVIDTCGYFTANVEDTAKLLADAVELYVFISSISVYRDFGKTDGPVDESSPLATCDDKYTLSMGDNFANYGPLKAYCEEAVEDLLPGRASLVRPGYIVGPRDRSDRFTYWPLRFARGGEVLAPGDPKAEQQFVDVRDLGTWLVHVCENRMAGPFNATGFRGSISTQELLHTGKGTLNHDCSFTWVPDEFLTEHGVTSWGQMPCWTPASEFNYTDCRRAIEHGLTFRPIAETLRDTLDWAKRARPDGLRNGLTAARESELLAKWKNAEPRRPR